MALHGKNSNAIQRALTELNEPSKLTGLEINDLKTEYVVMTRKSTTDGLKIKNQKSCCRTKANNGNQNEISEVFLDENFAPRVTDNEMANIVQMDTEIKHENICKRRLETYNCTVDDEYFDRNRIFKKCKYQTNDTSDEECEYQNRLSKRCNNRINDNCEDKNRISERYQDTMDEECEDPKKISKRDKDQTNHRLDERYREQPKDQTNHRLDERYREQPKDQTNHRLDKRCREQPKDQTNHRLDERYREQSNERNIKVGHRHNQMTPDSTKEDICQCSECQQRLHHYLKSLTDQIGKNSLSNNVEVFDCNCNRCQSDTRLKTESILTRSSNGEGNLHVKKMQNSCTCSSQALCGNPCSKIAVGSQHNKAHKMCSNLQLSEEVYKSSQPISKCQINETDPIPDELSEENISFSDFILAQNLTDTDPKEQLAKYARYLKREMKGKLKSFNSFATTFKDGLHKQDSNNDSEANRHPGENENDDQSSKCVIM